ncbi:hypothetical protein DVH24_008821 [Malus domestica]|uniref:Cytochrome P450 n=1 Tax=Malus domestica TaxID=3750 RepID=A0A498JN62_MALDO|nr:hypothetical protein DVH24_008821 [Malus domestica]
MTFENIGKLYGSLEPGPLLDTIDNLFEGLMKGYRAQPLNILGTALHHARQCRKKLEAIVRLELEKKKSQKLVTNDLMDGLMQIKDEEEDNMAIKKNKKGDFITSEDVSKMKYTNKVVEETIRMAKFQLLFSERLSGKLSIKKPAKPGTYEAFGGGKRICAGNMLVRIQLAILLHHLSTGYKWELVNPDAEMSYLADPKPVDGVDITIKEI